MPEVELKFELPVDAHAAFRRLAPIARGKPVNARLHALYFDTPDFELRRREMALRLRRSGRRWVQTLKAGHSGAGGLHAREEWEFERPQPSLDLALFAGTPLDARDAGPHLAEIFQVNVRRTTWELEVSPGNRVEVALDRGEVTRLGERDAVSEVEIESLEGDPLAVFDLAEQLLQHAPLRPSAVTKAQRGYRLARGEEAGPAKARPSELDANGTPASALRVLVAASLEQVQANEAGVLGGSDPEYLHQFRVGLRRLRSALRVFRTELHPDFAERMREELRWIARATSSARDWDVLCAATLPAILQAFGEARATRSVKARVTARRKAASKKLHAALRSPRYARLLLQLARWLASSAVEAPEGGGRVGEFAVEIVKRRHKRLVARASRLSALTPVQRHELRLEAKRLRYALEGFETLLGGKRYQAYRELLAEIQDDLGRANDAAVAARLLPELDLPTRFAHFARGWLAAETHSSVAALARHGDLLATARMPRERN
ncbi:MAG TPA: CHAD domain-containing protein [Usitatibacter sp.]|nr:CHAD domain-containing protein [Usitatibacter sp.]